MTTWGDEQNVYDPNVGMTIGQLFQQTYGDDAQRRWEEENARNNPPPAAPSVNPYSNPWGGYSGDQSWNPSQQPNQPAAGLYYPSAGGEYSSYGGGGGGGGGRSVADQIDEIIRRLTTTAEAREKEQRRQWDVTQGNWERQFGLQQRGFDAQRQQFQDQLAQALLGTSASMRGPRDYAAFQKYTSGGRNLLDTLRGGQSRPAFSAPTGPLEPQTIESVMARLRGEGGGGGDVGAGGIPLPFQINPAVWDSLGPVGQQLLLGLAEQAGWDADEFMRQLNAARPQGSAAGPVRFSYRR